MLVFVGPHQAQGPLTPQSCAQAADLAGLSRAGPGRRLGEQPWLTGERAYLADGAPEDAGEGAEGR